MIRPPSPVAWRPADAQALTARALWWSPRIVVGASGAGKTVLARRLVAEGFIGARGGGEDLVAEQFGVADGLVRRYQVCERI
jgi:hypothetical protein